MATTNGCLFYTAQTPHFSLSLSLARSIFLSYSNHPFVPLSPSHSSLFAYPFLSSYFHEFGSPI